MSAYGDSETESEEEEEEEEEEDLDNMDSVSVIAAQGCRKSAVRSSKANGSNDNDSGRGESPESSNGGGIVRVRMRRSHGSTTQKAPRPISAVPSEYSDISTSSYRSTTSEGDEEEGSCEHPEHQPEQKPLVSHEENEVEDEVESEDALAIKMVRVHRTAQELLMTEELYVKTLHLIDQVSCKFFLDFFFKLLPRFWTSIQVLQSDDILNFFDQICTPSLKLIYWIKFEFNERCS